LLKVYQVKYTTAKNTVFRTFGYVSTAGGYATVTKGYIGNSEIRTLTISRAN